MSDRTPPVPGRSGGWFADRPLSVKFGALAGVSVLAFGGLVGSVLVGNSAARQADEDMTALAHAQSLVLQLDTRASELKVDAFRALVREVPAEARTEIAEDTATAHELLTELSGIELTGESAAAVGELRASFDDYTAAVGAFVDTAVADQAAARAGYEQIQAANDLTDGTVSAAKDALGAATEDAEGALVDNIDRTGTITQVVAGIGVALVLEISWLTMR